MKSLHILWVLVPYIVVFGLDTLRAISQDHSSSKALKAEAIDESASPEIQNLIQRLGSNSFAERETASSALLAKGELALSALRELSPTASVEVRQRVALIQQHVEADKFAALSRSFLLDLDASKSYGLPAWHKYRELVGATRCSKLMFLDMIRHQPALSQLIEAASGADASPAAMRSLRTLASVEAYRLREEMFDREPRLGDAVGMLLAAATMPNQTPVEISEVIIGYERQAFCGYIDEPGYVGCLGRLMSAWLPKTHQSMAPMAMECALQHGLREGAKIAREHLTPNFDGDTRTLAFYCLARFGDETDVSKLAPYMSEQRIVDQFARAAILGGDIHISDSAPPGVKPPAERSNSMVVRINDLAITAAMILLQQSPAQLYSRFESHSKNGFSLHSLAAPPELVDELQQQIDTWMQQHIPPPVGT